MRGQQKTKRTWSGTPRIALVAALIMAFVGLASAGIAPVRAQDASLVVWYTLDDVGPMLEQVSREFSEASGVAVDVQYVRPQQLYDAMTKGGPDVILASSDDIGPLVDDNLVQTSGNRSGFFLEDVLDALPALIDDTCPEGDVASCLWPRVSPTLPTDAPDAALITRTQNWLCNSADWMPMCSGDDLTGVPVSWWFNVYLVSDSWLVKNGVYVPANAGEIDELRSEYGLDYEWASERSLPLAETADASTVYIFPSSLLVQDPQGLMRSLGSFNAAGYLPVIEIGIDSLFISANSPNAALAEQYAAFVADATDLKVDLMTDANLLPALDVAALQDLGQNATGTQVILRATTILTAYTVLVY